MKGTFNQGWWNCFESFAAELMSMDNDFLITCRRVLADAGITKREAEAWLNKPVERNRKVEQVVRGYWLNLKS